MPKPSNAEGATEVVAAAENDRRQRRRSTREEKLRILAEAEHVIQAGGVAAGRRDRLVFEGDVVEAGQRQRGLDRSRARVSSSAVLAPQ